MEFKIMNNFKIGDRVKFVKAMELDGMTGEVAGYNDVYSEHCIVILDIPLLRKEGQWKAINITQYCLEKI
jgi:hypothetical protein